MLCCAVLCRAVLCYVVLCCVVPCCAVLCCALLCCPCYAVLCCAVLCCAVLCCVFSLHSPSTSHRHVPHLSPLRSIVRSAIVIYDLELNGIVLRTHMCMCMYVCMYMYVYVFCICICICILYMYMYMCMYMLLATRDCTYVHTYNTELAVFDCSTHDVAFRCCHPQSLGAPLSFGCIAADEQNPRVFVGALRALRSFVTVTGGR